MANINNPDIHLDQLLLRNLISTKNLLKIQRRFEGLCDITSNYIADNDLLSSEAGFAEIIELHKPKRNDATSQKYYVTDFDDSKLQILETYAKSHILKITNIFEKIAYSLTGYIRFGVLNIFDKIKIAFSGSEIIDTTASILEKKFKPGKYIKFSISRNLAKLLPYHGHSMLLYCKPAANGEKRFTFYDPDRGILKDLSSRDLAQNMHNIYAGYSSYYSRSSFINKLNGTSFCLIDQEKFLKSFSNVDYELSYLRLAISLTVSCLIVATSLYCGMGALLSLLAAGTINPIGNVYNNFFGDKKITPNHNPQKNIIHNVHNQIWNVLPMPFTPKWAWKVDESHFQNAKKSK